MVSKLESAAASGVGTYFCSANTSLDMEVPGSGLADSPSSVGCVDTDPVDRRDQDLRWDSSLLSFSTPGKDCSRAVWQRKQGFSGGLALVLLLAAEPMFSIPFLSDAADGSCPETDPVLHVEAHRLSVCLCVTKSTQPSQQALLPPLCGEPTWRGTKLVCASNGTWFPCVSGLPSASVLPRLQAPMCPQLIGDALSA